MARVTVEDCVWQVPNRFELVVLASERAKHIAAGAPLTVAKNNDKITVLALREIAAGNIDINSLQESQIVALQKNNKIDEAPDENVYAEARDNVVVENDYLDSADAEFLSEPDDIDLDFSDNVVDEDK